MAPMAPERRAGAASLQLRVVDGEQEYFIWVQKTWKMNKVMAAFWAGSCKRPHPARFTFRGQKIRARQTPEMLGMTDGDAIQFKATGRNPKALLLEDLTTLTGCCEQINNGLKEILELSSRRFQESWNGTSCHFFLSRAEVELEARTILLQGLCAGNMEKLFGRGASASLASIQAELTGYLAEASKLDGVLCKAAFADCATNHGKDAVDFFLGKMCILGVENTNTLRKRVGGLHNAHLWPEFQTHIEAEIPANHNQQDMDGNDVSMSDEEDVCAICYDPVGKAEQATNVASKVAACCKKPFHIRCLAEWYAHSVCGCPRHHDGACPRCRAVVDADKMLQIYNMALTTIGEAQAKTPGYGDLSCWVLSWIKTVVKMSNKDAEVVMTGGDGITIEFVPERRGSI